MSSLDFGRVSPQLFSQALVSSTAKLALNLVKIPVNSTASEKELSVSISKHKRFEAALMERPRPTYVEPQLFRQVLTAAGVLLPGAALDVLQLRELARETGVSLAELSGMTMGTYASLFTLSVQLGVHPEFSVSSKGVSLDRDAHISETAVADFRAIRGGRIDAEQATRELYEMIAAVARTNEEPRRITREIAVFTAPTPWKLEFAVDTSKKPLVLKRVRRGHDGIHIWVHPKQLNGFSATVFRVWLREHFQRRLGRSSSVEITESRGASLGVDGAAVERALRLYQLEELARGRKQSQFLEQALLSWTKHAGMGHVDEHVARHAQSAARELLGMQRLHPEVLALDPGELKAFQRLADASGDDVHVALVGHVSTLRSSAQRLIRALEERIEALNSERDFS